MILENLNQFSSKQNLNQKKTIFSQNNETLQVDSPKCLNPIQAQIRLKCYIRKILRKKQNLNFKEGFKNLKQNRKLEGYSNDVQVQQHQCFSYFNQALQNARSLRQLDLSGMDIDPLLAIEIGQAIQKNSSLLDINLSCCNLNSSSLQYIFSSISNHQTLQSINLFNNQGFNQDLVNDICQFVFKGKNCLKKLKLTHCNISSTSISYLLRNLKYSKTITQLDLSMMDFTTDVLTSLGMALQHYKGQKKILEYLNIGYSHIKNSGLEVLASRVSWNMRKINIKELILKRNFIDQQGIPYLETFLQKINYLQRLDLSQNNIEEFNCPNLLQRQLYEINLSQNLFQYFPQQFFLNTLVINLSSNNISSQGAFQLSSILRQNPLWIELNLSNNNIKSEGFNSLIFGLRDNKQLKKIIVTNNDIDGEGLFTYMINHEQVSFEYLDISYNCIRFQMVFFVLSYIKSGKLKCLKCEGIKLQENSLNQNFSQAQEQRDIDKQTYFFNELSESSNRKPTDKIFYQQFQLTSHNVRELNFSNNKFIITPIINSLTTYYNKIEVLDLSSCQPITEQDIDTLSLLVKKSTFLHNLNLSNLGLGYKPQECLKKFRKAVLISSLKSLSISRNQLFLAAKAFQIEDIIFNYKLERLDYSNNGFQAKHAIYLETVLQSYRNLQELDLSHNNIDFSGIIMIQKYSKEKSSLRHLNLSYQKLRADDLLIISHIISNQNLISLNLSHNNSIKRMKTFFNLCSSKKIELLHLNHIDFDKQNFLNCVDVIKRQKKAIIGVIIDFCNFHKQGYEKLSIELIKCKNLQVLSMNYNPFIYLDLDKAAYLLNETKKMKILEFTQITFTGKSFRLVADWLQNKKNCSIETLKLRESFVRQEWFDELSLGIANNKTIKNLIFEKCELGKLSLYQFGKAIASNSGLEVISLEENNLTDNLQQLKLAIIETGRSLNLKKINLSKNPIVEKTFIEFFFQQDGFQNKMQIKEINLETCQINFKALEQTLSHKEFLTGMFLSNTISLCLGNNQLNDDHCKILANFLSLENQLEYLYLSQNSISSVGINQILNSILNGRKIILLDVSQNVIDDQFAFHLKKLAEKEINLQFLLLRNNKFGVQGQKCLSSILNQQEFLFIDNIWSSIDDEDADHILQQYTRIGQKFRLCQQSLPQYVKEILLLKSNLTDKFCKSFGKYYPLLNFIELIDISDNPYITMYGKTYLFFYLFDLSFEKHNLTAMYITNSQEYRNLYDDGLLRYFTLGFRNFLLPFNSNNNQVLQSNKIEASDKIFGGLIGSWILHKVNKVLFYLDLIQPPTFIVSTLFIGKFRKKNTTLKLLIGFYLLVYTFVDLLQFRNLSRLDSESFQKCQFSQVLDGNCDLQHQQVINNFTYTMICFLFILILDFSQLIFMVILRRKIKPALQIVYPKMIEKLHSNFPNNREWLLMVISVFRKFETLPERMFLSLLLQAEPSKDQIFQYQLLFTTFILWRSLDQFGTAYYNFIYFVLSNPREDQANYLSLLQRNLFNMNYQIPSDILASFCPIIGYQLKKSVKISYAVLIEGYRMICFDVPLLIIICHFCQIEQISSFSSFFELKPSEFEIWLTMFFFKCVISIIVSAVHILTLRPAVVKQHGFNQALAIKRFHQSKSQFVNPQDLKIEESISQFIQKIDKINQRRLLSQKDLDLQSEKTRNLDFNMQEILEEDENTQGAAKSNEQLSEQSVGSVDSPQSPLRLTNLKFKYKI